MKLRKNSILYKDRIPGYGTVRVLRCRLRGEKVRVLTVDRAAQSAVRAEEGDHRALLFDYMEGFDWICRLLPDAGTFFMIGGGGFSYPRHFCSAWPDRRMDVAELRPEILSLARQYLFFDDRKYPNLRIFIGDGLSLLRGSSCHSPHTYPLPEPSDTLYDAIINDAFTGRSPSGGLADENAVRIIHDHLKKDGVYCINLATALKGPFAIRTHRHLAVLRKYFRHTLLLPVDETKSAFSRQNCLLFASGTEFRFFQD